jgi:hypothetical protein
MYTEPAMLSSLLAALGCLTRRLMVTGHSTHSLRLKLKLKFN